MSDTLGRITVPSVSPSGDFPLTGRWPFGRALSRPVVTHQFGAANAKLEQRFFVGTPGERYHFQHPQLTRSQRTALRNFYETQHGSAGAFTYQVPEPDGTFTAKIVAFENEPLTFQELSDAITSVGITFVEIPTAGRTCSLSNIVTRFPDGTLNPALLSQVQEIIPLIKLRVSESAVPDIFLSDRRVTIGSTLYLPRLLRIGESGNEPLITQSIPTDGNAPSDDVTFVFGNADRIMVQLANDTQLRWARVELSLFHTGTGIKLDVWAGAVTDWQSDAGPEFVLRASDPLSALTLSSPVGTVSRLCWRRYQQDGCPATGAIDTTHFPSGQSGSCDLGYNTPNGCMAHQAQESFGGIYATPQGVVIMDKSNGGTILRASSIISDTLYGEPLPEIWHNDDGVAQWALPVRCKIASGRDESDFYIAIGLIGRGPLGALAAPAMWDSNADGVPDTFVGSTLDGQSNHGAQYTSAGILKPGSVSSFGLRSALGSDPAGTHDYFSLGRVSGALGLGAARGWYTNPADSSPMREVADSGSAYNFVYAAGMAFLEIRRTDAIGVQPSLPQAHELMAMVSRGLDGYAWSGPGSRSVISGCTNPVWVAINTYLRARGVLGETADTQEQYFDVASAVAAAAICDTVVPKIFGTGTEKQFRFKGVLDQRRPTRDWLQFIVNNCSGYFTWSFGKLKIGVREDPGAVSAFTTGNMLFNSLVLQPTQPRFEKLTAKFADQEYQFQGNTVDYVDQAYAARFNRVQNPFVSEIELTGAATKSEAARLITARAREELGGITLAEQDRARIATFRTTVLALETEAGQVVSVTDADVPTGSAKFRILSWRLNRDWSIDITAKTITDSMYDMTVGPKTTDVAAAPIPTEALRDANPPPAPIFGVEASALDPTVAEVTGLTFADSADTHSINAGTWTFYYCDPTVPLTTLGANLGLTDVTVSLISAAGVAAGDFIQVGREILLCGAPTGGVVPITRSQIGSTADTASVGGLVYNLDARAVTVAFPLDFVNTPAVDDWKLEQALPDMRLASVTGVVTNAYGDSPTTFVNVSNNINHGITLSSSAAGSSNDAAYNVTNGTITPESGSPAVAGSGTNVSPFVLAALQQVLNVVATTQDVYLLLPSETMMVGLDITINLASGSTHSIYLRPNTGDTIAGSSSAYQITDPSCIVIEGV